jgi:hypothetical protein
MAVTDPDHMSHVTRHIDVGFVDRMDIEANHIPFLFGTPLQHGSVD